MFNSFPIPKPDSGGNSIKSIQIGSISIAAGATIGDATITTIDITKSIILFNVNGSDPNWRVGDIAFTSIFTSATNVRFERAQVATSGTLTINYQIIEFNNVKSKQTGTATTSPITVTAVNTSKSILVATKKIVETVQTIKELGLGFVLSSSTSLVFTNSYGLGTIEWQLIEFN